MKEVAELRALQYMMLEEEDFQAAASAGDDESLGEALSVLVTLASESGQNIGVSLVDEDGQNYMLIVFKDLTQ